MGRERLERAEELASVNPAEATALYESIIVDASEKGEEAIKEKEQAVSALGQLYVKQRRSADLAALLRNLRPFFALIPKARTAKIVRTVIDLMGQIPETADQQIALCRESIEWTKVEKRTFLRQRIETRLSALYFEQKDFQSAMTLVQSLLREVRKLDDKSLLVEISLLESRIHHSLRNLPKSRASLTGARTAANAIYCPPQLQAELDMMSGILHADEKDYKTGYSYFFESFEGYNTLNDSRAMLALKYMCLCRIMTNLPQDVHAILSGKNALRYGGADIDAMRAVASAYQGRSLFTFEEALQKYPKELRGDAIVHNHLTALYENLLEQDLIRRLEPFSRVQIAHIAELIRLPVDRVESKLSQMILDKKFLGTLDHSTGCVIVFDDVQPDKIYPAALDVIHNMNSVVDSLFQRAAKLAL